MKKMGMPLLFACVPLLAGCYAGVGHMLEEDYNPRFVMGEYEELEEVQQVQQEEVPPPPEKVQEYTATGGSYGLQNVASGAVSGTTHIVSLAKSGYAGPFPLPDDMRWFLETPEGVVPKQRVDITYCYTPPTSQAVGKESCCLTLPSQLELGLTYITSEVSPNVSRPTYREQYNPNVKSHYKVIGEGTLDDGTVIRIKSELATVPTI